METTRSDCHAWGSSPNIEFFPLILGIESDAPYFKKIKIKPNLGNINNISGEMPHPAGTISVDYNKTGNGLNAEINLPEGISGTFVWEGKSYDLKGGLNKVDIFFISTIQHNKSVNLYIFSIKPLKIICVQAFFF